MNNKKIAYIEKFLPYDPAYDSEYEDLFFFKQQVRKEREVLQDSKALFKSDYSLLQNKYDPEKTIFDLTRCKSSNQMTFPGGKSFALVLTHDIDQIYASWKYSLYFGLKKGAFLKFRQAWNLVSGKTKPYKTFSKIVEIEKKYKARSTFFFLTAKKNYPPPNYDLEQEQETLELLRENNAEFGLHGGFYSYNDKQALLEEKQKLEQLTGKPVIGYRGHFLRLSIPDTWSYLEELGFAYDSTFGWNDKIGFRNGLPYPFKPYNINTECPMALTVFPLMIMDSTLFTTLGLSPERAFEEIKKIIDTVRNYNGICVLNWHNTYFDGNMYKGYDQLYEQILRYGAKMQGWLTSCRDLYNYLEGVK